MEYSLTQAKPNILLVTSVSGSGFNLAPPLGLYRLKQYLNERGYNCDILDLDVDDKNDYLAAISSGYYKLIGLSVSHFKMEEDLNLLWSLKKLCLANNADVYFFAGGQEATLNYEEWLKAGFEFILTGYAEDSLFQVCETIYNYGEKSMKAKFTDVKGIIYYDAAGKVINNFQDKLTAEIFRKYSYTQELKMDIPYEKYWSIMRQNYKVDKTSDRKFVIENVRLYTTSHCPRACGFCSSQNFLRVSQNEKCSIIMLSAEEIFNLLVFNINKYGARSFLFSDDDFLVGNVIGISRIEKLCEMIIEAKEKNVIPGEVMFNCQARIADFISNKNRIIRSDLIKLMKKAGFNSIGLGVETFSDRLLRSSSINKVGISANDCMRVLDELLVHKVTPQINIITGIPEYKPHELLATIKTAIKYIGLGCDIAVTPKMFSIPGAPIHYRDDYSTVKKYIIDPLTQREVVRVDYIVPFDEGMQRLIEVIDVESKKTLNKYFASQENDLIPKLIIGLSIFLTIAEFFKDENLSESIKQLLNAEIGKIKQNGGK